MKLFKQLSPFVYILLSFVVNIFWFKEGEILAGAELGLTFYDYKKLFHLSRYLWQDNVFAGSSIPSFMFYLPLSYFGSLLQSCGLSSFSIQRLLYFLLFAINGIGMYFLVLYFLKGRKERYLCAFIAGLFYMFNAFSMISVYNRFILTHFFVLAFLPLALLFYARLLHEGKVLYFYLQLLIFVAFSCIFAFPSNNLIIIFLFGSYFLFFVFNNRREKRKCYQAFFNSFLLIAVLIIGNLWWLISYYKSTGFYAQLVTTENNIISLKGVSQYFTLPAVIQGVNLSVINNPDYWGDIYATLFFNILGFVPFSVVIMTIYIKFKDKIVCYFGLLTLITLFVMKGSNPPFGVFIIWLFKLSVIFQVFRNPYEKFGLLWPLSYSFLFGYGLGYFYYWMKEKVRGISVDNS
jgi:hypothetical protein